MKIFGFTFAGVALTLAAALVVSAAQAAPPKSRKCTDAALERDQREECLSPTFPNQDRGPCLRGACYRGGIHKNKKPKARH